MSTASEQIFASDFATRDQSGVISNVYRWGRWESMRSYGCSEPHEYFRTDGHHNELVEEGGNPRAVMEAGHSNIGRFP